MAICDCTNKAQKPLTQTLKQEADDKKLFEKCVSVMEGLECGSRERFPIYGVGVVESTHRALSFGNETRFDLVTKQTHRSGLTGCIMHSWDERESTLTVTSGQDVVFKCMAHDSSESPSYPTAWKVTRTYVSGKWETYIDAVTSLMNGKAAETDESRELFNRIRSVLRVGIFGIETFDDAMQIMRRK
jgi:hypothetical protein